MSKELKAKVAFDSSSETQADGSTKQRKQFTLIVKWNTFLKKQGLTEQQIKTVNKAVTATVSGIATLLVVIPATLAGTGVI